MLYIAIGLAVLNIGLSLLLVSKLSRISKTVSKVKEHTDLSWGTLKALRVIMTDNKD